jgi:NAD(P)-dependent dehydrogenase (short-subunit alcohol dehydrogenase family)
LSYQEDVMSGSGAPRRHQPSTSPESDLQHLQGRPGRADENGGAGARPAQHPLQRDLPGRDRTNIEASTDKRHTERIGIEVELPQGSPAIDAGVGDVDEVADTCLFLASDLSRHVSGVEIFVDGGASLLH